MANTDRLELQQRLQDAMDSTLGLRMKGYSQGQIADAMWGAFQIGEYTTLD